MQNRTRVYCFNVQQTELKWTALCNMVLLEQNHGVLFQLAPLNYIHPPYGTSHTLHWFHAYECVFILREMTTLPLIPHLTGRHSRFSLMSLMRHLQSDSPHSKKRHEINLHKQRPWSRDQSLKHGRVSTAH